MNYLTIGSIGYGRLGSMYSKYCKAFDSRVLAYDPYKEVNDPALKSNYENLCVKFIGNEVRVSLHQ